MLHFIRKYQYGLMLVVAIVVIIAFAFLYDSTNYRSDSTETAYRVNGKSYDQADLQRMKNTFDVARSLQLFSLIGDLYGERQDMSSQDFIYNLTILRDTAAEMGLAANDDEIEDEIRNVFAFRNRQTRSFDPALFENFKSRLGSFGFTVADLYELIGDQVVLGKLKELLGANIKPAMTEVDDAYAVKYQKIGVYRIDFPADEYAKDIEVTDEEIKEYYEENKETLLSEELRSVEYVHFKKPVWEEPVPANPADVLKPPPLLTPGEETTIEVPGLLPEGNPADADKGSSLLETPPASGDGILPPPEPNPDAGDTTIEVPGLVPEEAKPSEEAPGEESAPEESDDEETEETGSCAEEDEESPVEEDSETSETSEAEDARETNDPQPTGDAPADPTGTGPATTENNQPAESGETQPAKPDEAVAKPAGDGASEAPESEEKAADPPAPVAPTAEERDKATKAFHKVVHDFLPKVADEDAVFEEVAEKEVAANEEAKQKDDVKHEVVFEKTEMFNQGEPPEALKEYSAFVQEVFKTPVGKPLGQPVSVKDGWMIFKVAEVEEPKELTLEEATEQIRETLEEKKRREALENAAKEAREKLVAALKENQDINEAAKAAELEVVRIPNFTGTTPPKDTPDYNSLLREAIGDTVAGQISEPLVDDEKAVLLYIAQKVVGEDGNAEARKKQIANDLVARGAYPVPSYESAAFKAWLKHARKKAELHPDDLQLGRPIF